MAEVLVDLVGDFGARAWLSYQCRDGTSTAAGEPFEDAVAVVADTTAGGIVAVGGNCTAPRFVPELLATARERTDQPLIAYPNGGDRWDAVARRWRADDGAGTYRPAQVASWTTLGAGWLGGCCGTGPDDIAELARSVRGAVA